MPNNNSPLILYKSYTFKKLVEQKPNERMERECNKNHIITCTSMFTERKQTVFNAYMENEYFEWRVTLLLSQNIRL